MCKILFSIILCCSIYTLLAQPTIQWQVALGGTLNDDLENIEQTRDGGFILTGLSVSDDGDVGLNLGYFDCWVVKLDSSGSVDWKRIYGGSSFEQVYAVRQTLEGGYILAGYTESNDGDVSGNHGNKDAWVLKLDMEGNIEWQKCIGGSNWDQAWDIQLTPDGGYIMAGYSASTDGDVSGNHGSFDYWVVKLNANADIEWHKSYGGSDYDLAYTIAVTSDGGYILAGDSQSDDGNVEGGTGGLDAWVVKLDFEGKIEWQHPLGGNGGDRGNEIRQTQDGSYILIGHSDSDNGDVSGNHGGYDFWVVKLDVTGEIEWQRSLGGNSQDYGQGIWQTTDGGYVLTGFVNSNNGDVTGNHGSSDLWLVKLSNNGEIQWQKAYGGTNAERGYCVQQTPDQGYIVAGDAWSNNGDVTGGVMGKTDFWMLKLAPESSATQTPASAMPLEIFPNPAQHSVTVRAPGADQKLQIHISDAFGRAIVHTSALNGQAIPVEQLPTGMYLFNAETPEGTVFWGKVWKQ